MRLTAERATHCATSEWTNVYYFINQSIQSDTWTEWWLNRHASCYVYVCFSSTLSLLLARVMIMQLFGNGERLRENHNWYISQNSQAKWSWSKNDSGVLFCVFLSFYFSTKEWWLIKGHTEHKHLAQYFLVFRKQIMHVAGKSQTERKNMFNRQITGTTQKGSQSHRTEEVKENKEGKRKKNKKINRENKKKHKTIHEVPWFFFLSQFFISSLKHTQTLKSMLFLLFQIQVLKQYLMNVLQTENRKRRWEIKQKKETMKEQPSKRWPSNHGQTHRLTGVQTMRKNERAAQYVCVLYRKIADGHTLEFGFWHFTFVEHFFFSPSFSCEFIFFSLKFSVWNMSTSDMR